MKADIILKDVYLGASWNVLAEIINKWDDITVWDDKMQVLALVRELSKDTINDRMKKYEEQKGEKSGYDRRERR